MKGCCLANRSKLTGFQFQAAAQVFCLHEQNGLIIDGKAQAKAVLTSLPRGLEGEVLGRGAPWPHRGCCAALLQGWQAVDVNHVMAADGFWFSEHQLELALTLASGSQNKLKRTPGRPGLTGNE